MIDVATKIHTRLASNANRVDSENVFPLENIDLLKETGLMSFLVPKQFGGYGGSIADFVKIARVLGSACTSTGMIWAMHCQQVACLVNHATCEFKEVYLKKIGERNDFIGSVTTERSNLKSILSSISPLTLNEQGYIQINREAPVVTGGINCDAYLITMKANETAPNTDVKFVYATKDQLHITMSSPTVDMLGMRGTNSIALKIKGEIPPCQIVNKDFGFDEIAYSTMIPMGHIGWASCWLGAAVKAFNEIVKILRDPTNNKRFDINSDLLLEKIARVRMKLDIVASFIHSTYEEYEELLKSNCFQLRAPGFVIKINNLKVFSSECLFDSINDLMEIGGVRFSYIKGQQNNIERVFRDLRSAALMINNDWLMISNGKLSLFDKSLR
ncbi:MAG: acyl-CoA dehydrogenase family protein [Flavisolibacter sp.]